MADERRPGDPDADWWTMADIAAHWGVAVETVRSYRARKPSRLPEPDDRFGNTPVWRPLTIIIYKRPGRGRRTDLGQ
ncbi:hypothetical protein ACFHW2_11940 [Actinomadura sp. LOL_016]|uniref:MarR family transcriptional regulator n=1 Tax=unclassified Actinomadura TaxID=2626254 RepID=UPI003A80B13A